MSSGFLLRAVMTLGGLRSSNEAVSSTFSRGHMTLAKEKLPMYIDRKVSRMVDSRSGFKEQFINSFNNVKNGDIEVPKYTFAFSYDKEAKTLVFKSYIFRPKIGSNGQPAVEVEDVNYKRENVEFSQSWYVVSTVESGKIVNEETSAVCEEETGLIVTSISDVLRVAKSNTIPEDLKATIMQLSLGK